MAEAVGADGAQLAAAVAAGVEITEPASAWPPTTAELRNSTFFEKGFHATSICGTFGAAVAAGPASTASDADRIADAMPASRRRWARA